MRRSFVQAVSFVLLAGVGLVSAQQPGPPLPAPRIAIVFPMGGQAGTSVEVTITGSELDDPTGLVFSSAEIRAEVIVPPEPAVDPKVKEKPAPKPKKVGPTTNAKFKVTIPPSVAPGTYDCRLVSKLGISNPRAFAVGDKPEVNETDKPHADVPEAQKVELGSVVNGVIAGATDVDYYTFAAKAGQRLLVHCAASSIDSRARPLVEIYDSAGRRVALNRNHRENDALVDFTAAAAGSYVARISEFAYQAASAESFYRLSISTAPWIDAVFPPAIAATGTTEVTLLGRNLPGGKVVADSTAEGPPLESLRVSITPPLGLGESWAFRGYTPPGQALQDGFGYSLRGPGGVSNLVPIYLTDAKVSLEKEAPGGNDKHESAEDIEVPGEIAGTIGRRYDKDWYRFAAKKGEVFWIDLFADRIGSNMDLYYVVKSADKLANVVDEQDDDPDVLHPQVFYNRSGDPAAAKFTAPADGKYLILVASRESNVNFGPRWIYRLKVSRPTPDFRAVVLAKARDLPTAAIASAGGEIALDIFADRRGGFTGPITALVEGLPAGLTAKPALIGTGSKWGTLVISAADSAAAFSGLVTVKCTAVIDGQSVVRSARPATITWAVPPGSNTPTISRLDQGLWLAVKPEKAAFRLTPDIASAKVKSRDPAGKETDAKLESPIFVKPGDKITLPIAVKWQCEEPRPNPLSITLVATQPNMQAAPLGTAGGGNAPSGVIPKEKNEAAIVVDVKLNAPPGTYALVFQGDTQISVSRDPAKKDPKTPANVQGFTQPLELTVLPLTLGKFTATLPANGVIIAGKTAEITVKVDRAHDYPGEFRLSLALPKDYKGVTVKDGVIPAGKDEGRLTLVVAPDAKIGGITNVVITATGTVHGKFPIGHEVKSNFAIAAPPKK